MLHSTTVIGKYYTKGRDDSSWLRLPCAPDRLTVSLNLRYYTQLTETREPNMHIKTLIYRTLYAIQSNHH